MRNDLKDERDMLIAINDRTLPAVSFYKPSGLDDEHPGYTNVEKGDNHVRRGSFNNPFEIVSSGMMP